MDYEKNIKKILKKYKNGIEYLEICYLYEKEYGIKLEINKPKKQLKNMFIIEDLNNGKWKIKNKEYENKNISNIDTNKTFTNMGNEKNILLGKDHENKYLNIHEPFSCVIVGVQGSGKSYTTNKIAEGCILETINKCSILVCHYDSNYDVICESIGLGIENSKINVKILTSPSNYFSRKKIYEEKIKSKNNNIDIMPLLFDFEILTTKMLKILMNIKIGDNQLYMQGIINVLRKKSKKHNHKINNIMEFENEIKKELNLDKQQQIPLLQRLELLKSFIIDSNENKDLLKYSKKYNFDELFKEGNLVIVDLTDDLIESQDANNIFRLLIEIFKSKNLGIPKLLIFDEAHKYFSIKEDGLTLDIVDIIRMQRHYGIRCIISTQNPCILNNEIIELSNFILLHRFSSPRWIEHINKLSYIKNEIFINNVKINTLDYLLKLEAGNCIFNMF